LIGPLILPTVWETRGNVPGAARLLAAIIPRAVNLIVAENQLEPILGIFQKLLSGKKTEQGAFDILNAIAAAVPK
jgi:exportin-2 (importin alpha re-exporter)